MARSDYKQKIVRFPNILIGKMLTCHTDSVIFLKKTTSVRAIFDPTVSSRWYQGIRWYFSWLRIISCLLINMEKSKLVRQFIAGLAATMSTLCAGYHLGWSSPSLPKLLAEDSDIPITSDQSSWIFSVFIAGSVFGPFIGAALVDRCGRKWSLLMTVVPYLSSCILIGTAQNYWWFIVARFAAGLGMGMTFGIAPIYLGEIADDGIRGALGTMLSLSLSVGILLSYSVGPWLSRAAFAGVGGTLPVVFGLIFVWMPESPHFLMMTEKPSRTEESLLWLKGTGRLPEELKKLQLNIEFDKKNAGSMKELVLTPGNRKALTIVLGITIAQQFSGITVILGYTSLIFEASGSKLDSNISVIIIGVVQLLSVVLTTFTVDLVGRRPLLLFSACSSMLCLGGEALYFQLQANGNDVSSISWLPVTAMIGYMVAYTIGFGALPLVILSEIFPYNVKALAAMTNCTVGSLTGVVVSKLYQVVADAYGIHISFWAFAGITAISVIFIYFMLPETKQRSLRSIQEELHKTTVGIAGFEKSDAA